MDRRTFLKALASFGASIALPVNLAAASDEEIDLAWSEAANTWDLFEVGEYRTLWYANFEEPKNRYEAYEFSSTGDVSRSMIESHGGLYEPIQDLYRDYLAEQDPALDDEAIEALVRQRWLDWCFDDRGAGPSMVESILDDWLSEEPDPCQEGDDYYTTGNAQGAAYDRFLSEDSDLMDTLGIVVIEGCCPGSNYYAAELHTPVEEANRIAAEHGWAIRFVYEGEDIVRYDRKPQI